MCALSVVIRFCSAGSTTFVSGYDLVGLTVFCCARLVWLQRRIQDFNLRGVKRVAEGHQVQSLKGPEQEGGSRRGGSEPLPAS